MGSALGAAIPFNGIPSSAGAGVDNLDVVITEGLGISYGLIDVRARSAAVSEGLGLSATQSVFRGVVIVERVLLALSQSPTLTYHKTVADLMAVAANVRVAIPAALTEGLGMHDARVVQLAVSVIERLGLAPALAPAMIYGKTLTETVRMAASIARFFGVDVIEGLGIAPTVAAVARKTVAISETMDLAATLAPQFVLRAVVTETIGLDDIDALSMIFNGEIIDGIELTAAYLSPGGGGLGDSGFTTWAVNTRTGAVTEYQNYAFNSFAQLGIEYYGATSNGLYKLIGDNDAGDDIIASLKSGMAQWAGSKVTLIRDVYLGLRGAGDYVLKINTADGRSYVYTVNAKDAVTTKVTVGKGLRARYWAFELISSGQDFDLDTVEFKPVVTDRRV